MKDKILNFIKYIFIVFSSIFFTKYMITSNNLFIYSIVALIFIYLLSNYKKINLTKSNKILIIIFSIILSFVAIIGIKLNIESDLVSGSYINNYMNNFKYTDIIVLIFLTIDNYILIIYIKYILNKYLNKIKINKNVGINSKLEVLFLTLILFIMYIPWLATYYPGIILADTITPIRQALNLEPLTNKYTIFYTFLIKICIFISNIFHGNASIGLFLLTIFQLIYIAFSESYMINWLKNKGINKIVIIILVLYFGLKPFYVAQNISMSRDPIFSISIMLLTLNLIDYIISNGKLIKNKWYIIKNILLVILICITRNNGFCVLLFTALIIFIIKIFKSTKIKYKFFGFLTLSVGLIYLCILSPIYSKLDIKEPFIDTVSTMMQQVAYTVTYNGKINSQEKEYLNNLMPLDKYKEYYKPCWIDMFKWSSEFNDKFLEDNKPEFFKTYFSMLIKNPYKFFKGYVLNTYGYWVFNRYELNEVDNNITISDYNRINYGIVDGIYNINILENKLFNFKDIFILNDKHISLAIINWFILFICLLAIINKKSVYITALAPSLGLFVSLLLATPNAYWQRYGLAEYYLLPIYIIILILIFKQKNNGV